MTIYRGLVDPYKRANQLPTNTYKDKRVERYSGTVREMMGYVPKKQTMKNTSEDVEKSLYESLGLEYKKEVPEKEQQVINPVEAEMMNSLGLSTQQNTTANTKIVPGEKQSHSFLINLLESVGLNTLGVGEALGNTIAMAGKKVEDVQNELAKSRDEFTGSKTEDFNSSLVSAGESIANYLDKKVQEKESLQAPEDMGKWDDPIFYARGLGAVIPQLGGAVLSALIGGAPGAAAYGYSQEAGSAYKEAKSLGANDKEAIALGDKIGVLNGILEMVGVESSLDKLPGFSNFKKRISSKIIKSLAKDSKATKLLLKAGEKTPNVVKGVASAGLPEAGTEAVQEIVSNVILSDLDENRKWYDNVAESGVFGFAGGAIVGGVHHTKEAKLNSILKETSNVEKPTPKSEKKVITESAKNIGLNKKTARENAVARAQIKVDKVEELNRKNIPAEKQDKVAADRLKAHLALDNAKKKLDDFNNTEVGKHIQKLEKQAAKESAPKTRTFDKFLGEKFGTREAKSVKEKSPRKTTRREYDALETDVDKIEKKAKGRTKMTLEERKLGLKAKDAKKVMADLTKAMPEKNTPIRTNWSKFEKFANKKMAHAIDNIATKAGAKKFSELVKKTLLTDNGKITRTNKFLAKIGHGYGQSDEYKRAVARMQIAKNKGVARAADIDSLLSVEKLSRDERIAVHQAIQNNGMHTNKKIADLAKAGRKLLEAEGKAYAKIGGISEETYNKGVGKYIARMFYKHELARNVTDWFKVGGKKKNLDRSKQRGITKKVATSRVDEYVEKGWENRGIVKANPSKSNIWRDYTPVELVKMGNITDNPGHLIAKGAIQTSSAVATHNFFKEVSKMKDYASDKPFADWKKMPNTREYGDLRNKYLSPYVYDDIKGVIEFRKYGQKVAQKALTLWKKSKVVYNPASISRNVMFNFVLSDFAGLSPTDFETYGKARKIAWEGAFGKEKNNLYRFLSEKDLFGGSYIGQDLNKSLRKTYKESKMDSSGMEGKTVMEMLDKVQEKFGKGDEAVSKFYQFTEEWNKVALFLHAKNEGMSIDDSVAFAKKWGLDYSAVSPAMVKLSRSFFGAPFLRFNLLVAPRLVEGVVKKPFTALKYWSLYEGAKYASLAAMGITDDEWDDARENTLPAWMDNRVLVPLPFKIDGKYQVLDVNNLVPFSNESFNPLNIVGSAFLQNPLFNSLATGVTQTDPFTKRKLWDDYADPSAIEQVGAMMGVYYKQLVPALAPGNYGWNKVQDAVTDKWLSDKGKLPAREKKGTVSTSLANSLLGVNIREIDVPKQIKYRLLELEKQYNYQREVIAKAERDPRISNEERVKDIEKAREKIKKIYEKRDKIESISPKLRQ